MIFRKKTAAAETKPEIREPEIDKKDFPEEADDFPDEMPEEDTGGGTSEKSPVRLKGVGNSLWVSVDPDCERDRLMSEVDSIFSRLNNIDEKTRVTLDIDGPEDYGHLFDELSARLNEQFGVRTVQKPSPKQREKERSEIEDDSRTARNLESSWLHRQSDVLMLTGRVRSGQKVSARNHLLIMGDVNPGAEVFAGGDILVLGTLLGTAIAGQPENEDAIILAMDFRPTQVQIGSIVAAGLRTSRGGQTEFAHAEEGAIVVENYLDANPFGRMPWPQVR